MGFNDGTLIFSYAFFVSSLQENTLMRRIASILSDLPHTTTDCSAVQPQQGRLHSCLVALDKATGDQEKQQEREFGMILEPRAEQLTTALQCVRSILGNISLHPDNEKLRRIRINHPAIKVCLCIIAQCVRVIVYDCVRMLSIGEIDKIWHPSCTIVGSSGFPRACCDGARQSYSR